MQDFQALSWSIAIFAAMVGYGLGAIPFGLLLTRLAGTADLRSIGSGNIGATNVLRTGRKDLAAATLLLDGLKGSLAVWLVLQWGLGAAILAGLAAFLGHLYPVWLRFSGGKGVATFLGVVLALWWPGFLLLAASWLAAAAIWRYSSLAALLASALAAVVRIGLDLWNAGGISGIGVAMVLMTILLWWKHRPNIARLLAGEEGRIGAKG